VGDRLDCPESSSFWIAKFEAVVFRRIPVKVIRVSKANETSDDGADAVNHEHMCLVILRSVKICKDPSRREEADNDKECSNLSFAAGCNEHRRSITSLRLAAGHPRFEQFTNADHRLTGLRVAR
jgi:hypothetical protein